MFDTEFGIERIVEDKSDLFVLYCPENKQYVTESLPKQKNPKIWRLNL